MSFLPETWTQTNHDDKRCHYSPSAKTSFRSGLRTALIAIDGRSSQPTNEVPRRDIACSEWLFTILHPNNFLPNQLVGGRHYKYISHFT